VPIIFTARAEEESIFPIFVCIGLKGAAKSEVRRYVKNPSKKITHPYWTQ
jgi:hypothetical protein